MHIWKKKETTIFLCILINLAKWTILNSLWRESQTLFMKSLWVFCSFFSSFLFVCFFFNEKNNYAVITTREIPHTTGLKSFSGMYKTQFALLPFLNLEPPSVWSSQENLTHTHWSYKPPERCCAPPSTPPMPSPGLRALYPGSSGSPEWQERLEKAQWRSWRRVGRQQHHTFRCSFNPGLCSPWMPFPVFFPVLINLSINFSPLFSPHLPFLLTTFPSTISRFLSLLASCPRKNSSNAFSTPQTRLIQVGGLQNFLYLCTHTFLTLLYPT